MHGALGAPRVVHPDDRRQEVVGDDDPLGGVLGEVAVAGHHHHDRLADVVDLVAGQRVAGARRGQRRVRDEQRQRLGDRAALGLVGGGEVVVGVDRDQAVDLERAGDVDVGDPGVRVRAAHERGGQRVVPEVVEEVRPAGDQLGVLDPLDRLAEQLGGHRGVPLACDLGGAQHDGDDVLVAGAAAQVAADRLAGLLLGRVRVLRDVRGDGGEEARRAEAALQPVALAERLLHRVHVRPACRGPRPWSPRGRRRVTASSRQERTGSPSSSTVQAPQTPCSQPTWVPVSRRSWRRQSDSSRRAGTWRVPRHAVHGQPYVVQAPRSRHRPPRCLARAPAAVSTRTRCRR